MLVLNEGRFIFLPLGNSWALPAGWAPAPGQAPNPLRLLTSALPNLCRLLAERHSFADKPSRCKNRPAKWRTSRLAGRSAGGDRRRRRWGAPAGLRSDVTGCDGCSGPADVRVIPALSLGVRAGKWRMRCDIADALPACCSCSRSSHTTCWYYRCTRRRLHRKAQFRSAGL